MNVESFSSGDGASFAYKFLLAHPKSMMLLMKQLQLKHLHLIELKIL
jgi:hypothetical protein